MKRASFRKWMTSPNRFTAVIGRDTTAKLPGGAPGRRDRIADVAPDIFERIGNPTVLAKDFLDPVMITSSILNLPAHFGLG